MKMRDIRLAQTRGMRPLIFVLGFLVVVAALAVERGSAQTVVRDGLEAKQRVSATVDAPAAAVTPAPLFTSYRSIMIGLPADEVKQKLGKPKVDDKDGFFYEISDDEFAQIRLDGEGKIRLIAVTYTSDNKAAPKFSQVIGGPEPAANPDGSVYRLVRYPSAGYWVAYSRSGGDNPTITVTMQKL